MRTSTGTWASASVPSNCHSPTTATRPGRGARLSSPPATRSRPPSPTRPPRRGRPEPRGPRTTSRRCSTCSRPCDRAAPPPAGRPPASPLRRPHPVRGGSARLAISTQAVSQRLAPRAGPSRRPPAHAGAAAGPRRGGRAVTVAAVVLWLVLGLASVGIWWPAPCAGPRRRARGSSWPWPPPSSARASSRCSAPSARDAGPLAGWRWPAACWPRWRPATSSPAASSRWRRAPPRRRGASGPVLRGGAWIGVLERMRCSRRCWRASRGRRRSSRSRRSPATPSSRPRRRPARSSASSSARSPARLGRRCARAWSRSCRTAGPGSSRAAPTLGTLPCDRVDHLDLLAPVRPTLGGRAAWAADCHVAPRRDLADRRPSARRTRCR